jgi:hemoglobin
MPMSEPPADTSLYRRLGGYDVIAGIIDEIFSAMKTDPRFARFGPGRSLDSKTRARQLTVDQICELAGGPCFYIGRDMRTSHRGLGITASEWAANMEITAAAIDKCGIPVREKKELLALFERYRDEIVEAPSRAP